MMEIDENEAEAKNLSGDKEVQLHIKRLEQRDGPLRHHIDEVTGYGKTGGLCEEEENVAAADEAAERLALQRLNSRLAMALFGGCALVAPMLVMTLQPTRLASLLTTSFFVIAVARALAGCRTEAESKDVIGATIAYAAVLDVFVWDKSDSKPLSKKTGNKDDLPSACLRGKREEAFMDGQGSKQA